jgi:serine/threonine protein kinase
MERLRAGDPEQIGPWQIVNRLGAGGMGLVYLGTDGTRAAAIKTVREHLLEDPTSRTRLAREVASLKKMKSRYIAEIVGSDVESTPAWIATSFVDGPSLKTLIEKEGPLKEGQWKDLAAGLFQAISAVHKVGIIHRDVKPSNILISATGPKLIDFGISFSNDSTSLTKTGLVAGTPAWLAPEQFENREITFAVDNFALGSVLYFAATGSAPWGDEDSSVAHVMRQILTSEPDLKKLTPLQKDLIGKLLEKDSKKRINSSKSLELLGGISETREFALANPSEYQRVPKARNKFRLIQGIAAVVIVIAASIYFFMSNSTTSKTQNAAGTKPDTAVSKTSQGDASKWSGSFEGDPVAQSGSGTKYRIYLCDQNISPKSLSVSPPSGARSSSSLVSLEHGNSLCGSNFDTIFASGDVPNTGSVKFTVVGKTMAGDAIKYTYTVTRG